MAKRVALSTLNASTIDILNVIRQNASYDYQSNVPAVEKASDIPKVGEVICGNPAFSNQFLNALLNRIAKVVVKSATFNNPFSSLKKGYLEFGETVEDIFVSIAKGVEFSAEKAAAREFKRTIPDVRSVFHVMNYRVMYPITIQDIDLKRAFLSMDGVQSMIAKIVDSVYTGAEYDEYLIFKYLLIKSISHGQFYPVSIGDGTKPTDAAVQFRGKSNVLTLSMDGTYNSAHVKNNTPKSRQVIFMDAMYNASFDVNVLASAFNMEKADFMGRLHLIDSWDTFDNERFSVITAESDGIEPVTPAELALMKNVKAVLVDEDWFQVYDNENKFTEQYVASGMYWNYFYHTWKTVSYSPFANAIVFVSDNAAIALPAKITAEIVSKSTSEEATVFTLEAKANGATLAPDTAQFVQTEALTTAGIAVHPYGGIIIPASQAATEIVLEVTLNGATYTNAATKITAASDVGNSVDLTKS